METTHGLAHKPAVASHSTEPPGKRGWLSWRRLGTYTGAGVISGLVNLALFHLALQAHAAPHLAWVMAFEVGALVAFGLHRHITWRDRRLRAPLGLLRQFGRAQVASVAALALNLAAFTLLMHAGVPDDLDDLIGLGVGFVLNYVVAHHFVYGRLARDHASH